LQRNINIRASQPGINQKATSRMTIDGHMTSPVRVLVSDNDDIVKAIANAQHNGERCETVTVNDGVQAMHTLLGSSFDLVIVDLAMPRLDGLRLIALIRATPALRHIPILAVASPQEPGSTLESVRAGADDYLARPIEWPQLAMRIRQLTRSSHK
jgi:CheY-like chemotaxis protein